MEEEEIIIQEKIYRLLEERQNHIDKAKEIEKLLDQISRKHRITISYKGR